jgi:pimeloyl-ACP methyl ester carboxylesterase
MTKQILLIAAFFFVSLAAVAQEKPIAETEISVNKLIKGTLFSPETKTAKTKLVILIAGSGPTNRSGNQIGMQNNSLRYLAQSIARNGNAVYSYDKRIFAQMIDGTLDEKSLVFEDFINDAKDVIAFFKNRKEYDKIIVAGHSEGSLIGIVAANGTADGFISIAGAGREIGEVIIEQIEAQAPTMKGEVTQNLDILRKGQTFELKNQLLASLFRASIQPYMISWLKYDPAKEVVKLKIPVLLINGTKDLQVDVDDAQLLKAAKPDAQLNIIAGMNHVLKNVTGDDKENMATYSNPDLPVVPGLVSVVNQFIKSI